MCEALGAHASLRVTVAHLGERSLCVSCRCQQGRTPEPGTARILSEMVTRRGSAEPTPWGGQPGFRPGPTTEQLREPSESPTPSGPPWMGGSAPPPRGGLGPGGGGAWERVSSRCGSVEAWRASATVVIAVPMARLPRALGFCLRRHIRSVRQAWMCSAWPTSVCRAPTVCETCAGAGGSGA